MIHSANYFHKVRRELEMQMSVTEESGGRLNAFAKEPKIEVLNKESRSSNGSRVFLIVGILLIIGLITFTVGIS